MARPERKDADYFPFYCKEGSSTKYIESIYGNDGFAVWIKILRQLTITNYHYLDLSGKPRLMVLASTCKVSEDLLLKIINDLVDLGEFDNELWTNDKIIWSDKFIDSIEDAYKNRKNNILKKLEFMQRFEDLTGKKLTALRITYPINTQSKVEYSKVEETKEEQRIADLREINFSIVKKAADLTDSLCEYFSVKTIVTSKIYNSLCDYVSTISHKNELSIASIALQKYMSYKARSKETRHNIASWIGTKESHYQDGQWIMIDWDSKNKNFKDAPDKGTTTAASTIQQPGKAFR